MTFEQIGYFLALAEEGSFVRAARRCGISQPSLSNAIRSLEAAMGAPLFERTITGSELTALGKKMRPLLAKLDRDRLRAIELAGAFDRSSNPIANVCPLAEKLASGSEQAAQFGRAKRRAVALGLAALLACTMIATATPAKASDDDVEIVIRESMPSPVRCARTMEPMFYCRHEGPPEHAIVLDMNSGPDGPSASLTYDYDNAKRHQLQAVMRGFFTRLGVPADTFDDCMSQAQWHPSSMSVNGYKILCYRVQLWDRVTEEVFMISADRAPTLAHAGKAVK
jgi:molybdenum-dependent DNA-binding transcriptional regulator ModE